MGVLCFCCDRVAVFCAALGVFWAFAVGASRRPLSFCLGKKESSWACHVRSFCGGWKDTLFLKDMTSGGWGRILSRSAD